MLMVGEEAPAFEADAMIGNGDKKRVSLQDFRGRWVVLFFYPLDFTQVCPTEILEFSRRTPEFRKLNAEVLGCSVDSIYAHKAFIGGTLGKIEFPLLSDMTREVSRTYGALVERLGHANRATFIIDPEGILQYAAQHNPLVGRSVSETLRVLEALQTGENCPVEWKRGQPTLGK